MITVLSLNKVLKVKSNKRIEAVISTYAISVALAFKVLGKNTSDFL